MRLRLLKSVLKNYYKEDRPKIQSYTPFPLTPLSKLGASIMGVKKLQNTSTQILSYTL